MIRLETKNDIYDINRIAAKTWPLSSGNTHKDLKVKKNSCLTKENSQNKLTLRTEKLSRNTKKPSEDQGKNK